MADYKIPEKTQIGHIHLTVSDLNKSIIFYRDILGFQIVQNLGHAVFLSAGGYHHHIGLNTWKSKNAKKPEEGHVGLYHFAILFPKRKDLANALKRLKETKYPITGVGDHGVSEAIYLNDPDGNGVELYWDRPKKLWPKDKNGNLLMHTAHVDVEGLLKEAD